MGPKLPKKNEIPTPTEPTFAPESHQISSMARLIFTMDERQVELQKLMQIIQLIPSSRHKTELEQRAIILRALDMYQSLNPADGLQGMLAEQMIGTHFAGLECFRLLAGAKDLRAREMYMKQAEKLLSLYLKQITVLTTLQGKGPQKVLVGHMNVAEGGQAIVGNVQTGAPVQTSRAGPRDRFDEDLNDTEIEP